MHKNRSILERQLYGKDLKDLHEVTSQGERNPVTVLAMLRTVLFQYDPAAQFMSQPSQNELEEAVLKLKFANELMWKLGAEEPEITEEDFNMLKALVMGSMFQAGSIRHQLLTILEEFEITAKEETLDIPSQA